MKNRIFVAVFAFLLGALCVLTFALPKKEFSENENRYLAAFPKLSFETVRDGSFMSDISEYIADHFVLRDGWVTLKSLAESALLKTENNGVFRGRDGYLIDSFDESAAAGFEKNLEAARAFETAAESCGIEVRTLLAPTAATVLKEYLPRFAVTADGEGLLRTASQTLSGFVDTLETLSAHKDEYIYYRTDHHWTALGAYYAYCAYEKSCGREPLPQEAFRPETLSDTFYGTTYSRFGAFLGVKPDTLCAPAAALAAQTTLTNGKGETHTSIYYPELLDGKDKYRYFLGGNDGILRLKTTAETGKNLLLIKDSYANSFLPYLIGDFDSITVLDMRYYNGAVAELFDSEAITDVLILYNLKSFCEDRYIGFINLTE
ncbi:MAG: hypothetical protein IJK23_07855 [Clostridia bacterium]|nr:hypothetical protein [Clostridia bacterium]